ncbi:MAG: hypothetical protein HQL82_14995 [Magnetococcales bacterium]|nr:hypothetical protein [Magnetococcales bacterium]
MNAHQPRPGDSSAQRTVHAEILSAAALRFFMWRQVQFSWFLLYGFEIMNRIYQVVKLLDSGLHRSFIDIKKSLILIK